LKKESKMNYTFSFGTSLIRSSFLRPQSRSFAAAKGKGDDKKPSSAKKPKPVGAKKEKKEKSNEDEINEFLVEIIKLGTPRVKIMDAQKQDAHIKVIRAYRDKRIEWEKEKETELKKVQAQRSETMEELPPRFHKAAREQDDSFIPPAPFRWVATYKVPRTFPTPLAQIVPQDVE